MAHRDHIVVFLVALIILVPVPATAVDEEGVAAVTLVLDGFHEAAAKADGSRYFGFFSPDAIFIGTDPSERWTVDEFRAFAEPYFDRGQGWTYVATSRHIRINGDTAWFDEMLENEAYGTCRGTGVLIRTDNGWKIAQYHLTIPIPNDLAKSVVEMIRKGAS